jgi:hypothetical protein
MKLHLRSIFLLILFFAASFPGMVSAQISRGGVPRSFSLAMAADTTKAVYVAPPSTSAIQQEDEQTPVPYRFAVNLPVDLAITTSGRWCKASDGTNVWRLSLQSPGALALTLYFDRFNLPEGGSLFVYNPQRTQLIGAFTSLNNNRLSTFATSLINGDQLTLEYNAPEGVALPEIHISEISYAYRGISEYSGLKTGFGASGKCQVNVNCPEGDNWKNQKRGVVRIQIKRKSSNDVWCTGSLVNNTKNDGTPYVLTADHCGKYSSDTNISQWIFYFDYESTGCPNPTQEPLSKTMTGATLVAHGGDGGLTGSDFFMVVLNSPIPDSYNVYYNGWSRETLEPSPSGVGIHHPQGDIKKISTYTARLQHSNWRGGANLSHWQVNWIETASGHGTTEGGSSGSPLFDNMGRIVGTLTGGDSDCDSMKLNLPDYYGQFAWSWESNGTDSLSVLKYWLDPINSGVMSLNGWALSVDEPQNDSWVTIYPNPATDVLNLRTTAFGGNSLQVIISDLWGKVILQRDLDPSRNREYQIGLTGFARGMYLVRVMAEERVAVRKIIIQ